jgi:hypothetical protein
LVVNRDFLKGRPFSTKLNIDMKDVEAYSTNAAPLYPRLRRIQSFFSNNYSNGTAVQNMTNADCMTAYGTSFVLVISGAESRYAPQVRGV